VDVLRNSLETGLAVRLECAMKIGPWNGWSLKW